MLNITDEQSDRLARELAAATGESITVAARRVIEERLARVRAHKRADPAAEELEEIIARGRARTVLDDRTAEQILGYDSNGLPA